MDNQSKTQTLWKGNIWLSQLPKVTAIVFFCVCSSWKTYKANDISNKLICILCTAMTNILLSVVSVQYVVCSIQSVMHTEQCWVCSVPCKRVSRLPAAISHSPPPLYCQGRKLLYQTKESQLSWVLSNSDPNDAHTYCNS